MTRSLRDDDGANAVEFALVLPILVILVFGIFTVGMAYDLKLVSNHAARDAARFGATLPIGDGEEASWFVDVRDRAVEAGEGHYGADTNGVICVALNDGEGWTEREWVGDTESAGVDDGCTSDTDGDLSGELVRVRLQHDAAYNIVFLPPRTLTLTSEAIARFEDRPVPEASPDEEE